MDPTTGFVNLLSVKYENMEKSKEFINKIKDINFKEDDCGKYYEFHIDFN